jgi:hypothetical protein
VFSHYVQEVYEVTKTGATLLCTLYSQRRGNFAITVADNLVVLHHQESKVRVPIYYCCKVKITASLAMYGEKDVARLGRERASLNGCQT